MYIENCDNITEIPNIQGLNKLYIYNCDNISEIPNIEGLNELHIWNCPKINFIETRNLIEIERFYSINKIKTWHKRMQFLKGKRYIKLWEIAEYYTKIKYSPANVLKYMNLDEY